MFTNFVVRNFRCFAGLHLKDLSRVNLIAGKNNTGKTALLEAIHLHTNPSNCFLAVTINKRHRGTGEGSFRRRWVAFLWEAYRRRIGGGELGRKRG